MTAQVKVVGANGQISLGKEFAGKTVIVDQVGEGSWVIKTGQFVPDSEKGIDEPKHSAKLEKATACVEPHEAVDNFEEMIKKLEQEVECSK